MKDVLHLGIPFFVSCLLIGYFMTLAMSPVIAIMNSTLLPLALPFITLLPWLDVLGNISMSIIGFHLLIYVIWGFGIIGLFLAAIRKERSTIMVEDDFFGE